VADQLPFLSEAWVEAFASATASLPERPGATAVLSFVVTGGPDGPKAEHAWRLTMRDGRVESAAVGAAVEGEADLLVAQPWADALAAIDGTASLDVSFMRGSTKVAGSTGVLMDLLGVLRSDEWREACRSVATRTAAA
jgi:hypothetical protein